MVEGSRASERRLSPAEAIVRRTSHRTVQDGDGEGLLSRGCPSGGNEMLCPDRRLRFGHRVLQALRVVPEKRTGRRSRGRDLEPLHADARGKAHLAARSVPLNRAQDTLRSMLASHPLT